MSSFTGTTILAVIKDGKLAIGGDGQVTLGNTVVKHSANKIRRLYNDEVLSGFAGSVADSFTLFERFDEKLNKFNGDVARSSIELAKEWRSDRVLRRLEAMLIVGNMEGLFILSGNGEVIQPDDNIASIGSGGPFAGAAAKALFKHSKLQAYDIVKEALTIAANICIYTNNNIIIEEL